MSRTVLVVEDADGIAPLEMSLAALEGVTVLVLSSGRDALLLIKSVSIELAAVITDLHLPFVDGFELIEEIRKQHRYATLPVLVISGDTRPETPARVRRLGANAFFAKPYSPTAIRQSLEDMLHVK
jgi:two-component system, sensor histidine kinase